MSALPAPESLLEDSLQDGPRLLVPGGWESLAREIAADPLRTRLLGHLRRRSAALAAEPPVVREMSGRRLLHVSRAVLDRVFLWALFANLEGDASLARRAERELEAAAAFSDWNPGHFLDVAEMTLALAVGYDWLRPVLSPGARGRIAEAIREKGLLPSLRLPAVLPTGQPGDFWVAGASNWTQVCHAGLVAGALVVGELDPALADEIVGRAARNVPRTALNYGPDGAYSEGAAYWGYGTTFHVLLLAMLRSARGDDYRLGECPGLFRSLVFLAELRGPTGLSFNYSDGAAELPVEAAFFWLAAHGGQPGLAHLERRRLAAHLDARERKGETYSSGRFDVPLLLWLSEPAEAEPELPRSWRGGEVAVHRSAWEPDALFVAMKGGSPGASHGHMDVGTFVLDAGGTRWAGDLGSPDYHHYESRGVDIWNLRSPEGRWEVLAVGPRTHNIVAVGEARQDPRGLGRIVRFSAAGQSTVFDLTEIHAGRAARALRGVALRAGRVLIQDELDGIAPGAPVVWRMLTRAEVALTENGALLRRDGKRLGLFFDGSERLALSVTEVDALRASHDMAYPGYRLVEARGVASAEGMFRLRALLVPGDVARPDFAGWECCERWENDSGPA